MPTPSEIQKQCVDIDLSGGLNEDQSSETVQWTKYLTLLENTVYKQTGKLSVRHGLTSFGTTDSDSASFSPVYRLTAPDNGVGFIGKDFNLYQLNDSRGTVDNKGRTSEFNVTHRTVGSTTTGEAKSVALTTNYECVLYRNPVANAGQYALVIVDRKSGNVVKNYLYSNTASTSVAMVGVGSRYLHFYVHDTTASPKFFQVDTLSLPASIGTSTVNLTSGGATSVVRGVVADSSTTSVVMYETAAGTTRFERFSTGAVSTATGTLTLAGLTNYGIDWNGTSSRYFVVGILTGAPNRYQLRELDTTFAVTRTVTDTTATTATLATNNISVAVNPATSEARIVAWAALPVGVANGTGGLSTNANFPHGQIYSCTSAAVTFTALGYLGAWGEGSLPVWNNVTQRFYIYVVKYIAQVNHASQTQIAQPTAVSSVLLDITAAVGSASVSPRMFRPACVVDYYTCPTSSFSSSTGKFVGTFPQTPVVDSDGSVYLASMARGSAGSAAIDSSRCGAYELSRIATSNEYASGGFVQKMDGGFAQEDCFIDAPVLAAVSNVLGATAASSGNYVGVFEYKDLGGRTHYSTTSVSSTGMTAFGANNFMTWNVLVPTVCSHRLYGDLGSGTNITMYHTNTFTGTTYLRAVSVPVSTTISTPSTELIQLVTDVQTTSTIASQPVMYRQPGSIGTALDRYHGVSCGALTRNKDRVFYSRGQQVYYSSFTVDNETEWFNPSFSFSVPGGSGPVTGLSSLDGVLVVFKRDALFLVDGDGPPENGGSGNEFSTPRRLSVESGCIDGRSIVQVENGIMYRSMRGIELLTRNGQIQFIGQMVQQTVDSNQYTTGACYDKNNGRAYFCLSNSMSSTGLTGAFVGVVLCYDLTCKAWSVHKYTTSQGSNGFSIQDIVLAKSPTGGGSDVENLWLTDGNTFYSENKTTLVDHGSAFIPVKLKTGWIKGPSMQDRIVAADAYVLGTYQAPHNVVVSWARDYKTAAPTAIKTFSDATLATLSPEQMDVHIPIQEVQAFQVQVETTTTGAPGNGQELDLTGLTVKLGIKGGGAKLAVAQKG